MKKWRLFRVVLVLIVGLGIAIKPNTIKSNPIKNTQEKTILDIGNYQYDERYVYLQLMDEDIIILDTEPSLHKIAQMGPGDALLLREPYLFVIDDQWGECRTQIRVYDISDRREPKEVRTIEVPGSLTDYSNSKEEICLITRASSSYKTLSDSGIKEIKTNMTYKDTLTKVENQPIQVDSGKTSIGFITKINVNNSSAIEIKAVGDGWEDYTFEKDYLLLVDESLDDCSISKYSIFGKPIQYQGTAYFEKDDCFSEGMSNFYVSSLKEQVVVGEVDAFLVEEMGINYKLYVLDEKMQQLGNLDIKEKNSRQYTISFRGDKAYLGNVEETTTCIDLSQPDQMKEVSQISIQPDLEMLYKEHQLLAVPTLEKDNLANEQFAHYKDNCLVLTVKNNKLQEVARFDQIRTFMGVAVTTDADYVYSIGDSLYYKYDNEISEYNLQTLEYKGNTILE